MLEPRAHGKVRVTFDDPQRAITPGQRSVSYDGDVIVDGGWIAEAGSAKLTYALSRQPECGHPAPRARFLKPSPTAAATSRARPSSYLKKFFFDTVNFDPRALELAVSFVGASQILAGSDYPHQIGSIPKMQESLKAMRVTEEERGMIFGGCEEVVRDLRSFCLFLMSPTLCGRNELGGQIRGPQRMEHPRCREGE